MARQRRRGVPQSDDLVVLDVGSNVGLFTAALAEKGSKIGVRTIGHLFEPSWELHHEGKRRLSSVEGARLYHHNFALSDGKRSAWLAKNRKDNPGWNGLAEEHDPLTPVREGKGWMDELVALQTLDGVWRGENAAAVNINANANGNVDVVGEGPVDIIKIDVEGHEASVLSGAMDTIARFKPILFIEVAWGTGHPAWASRNKHVYAELERIGYALVGEHVGSPGSKGGELVTDRSKIAGLEAAAHTRNLVFACEA